MLEGFHTKLVAEVADNEWLPGLGLAVEAPPRMYLALVEIQTRDRLLHQ
jgi:hypothetical protein